MRAAAHERAASAAGPHSAAVAALCAARSAGRHARRRDVSCGAVAPTWLAAALGVEPKRQDGEEAAEGAKRRRTSAGAEADRSLQPGWFSCGFSATWPAKFYVRTKTSRSPGSFGSRTSSRPTPEGEPLRHRGRRAGRARGLARVQGSVCSWDDTVDNVHPSFPRHGGRCQCALSPRGRPP
eukprot:6900566-Prymnesium_polylepis.1